jgi:dihydroxy-acid dehydratase
LFTRRRRTSTGARLGEIAASVEEKPGQKVVVPIDTPIKPIGGLAILRGNSRPRAAS